MIPLGLFRNPTFTAANMLTLFLYAALAALFFFLPFVLIQARRLHAGRIRRRHPSARRPRLRRLAGPQALSPTASDPRVPLTLGPLIAGAGFALFAILPAESSYAASILPALAVLGVGMAVTVAPLTATILNAVDPQDQGTASGINNAVARVAGLLAIAVFGIVVAGAFQRALDSRLDAASVSAETRRLLEPERSRLGAMEPPAGVESCREACDRDVRRKGSGLFLPPGRPDLRCSCGCGRRVRVGGGLGTPPEVRRAQLIGSGRKRRRC